LSDNESPQKAPRKQRQAPRLPPTREELISLGEDASRLLLSPVFNVAVRDAIESWQDRILTSQPHETELRESMYFRMRALNDVLTEFPGFINAARSMTEEEASDEFSAEAAWTRSMSSHVQ
jgi:hypothetical protein